MEGAVIEIHERDGVGWKFVQEIQPPEGRIFVPHSVALSGPRMVVGGRGSLKDDDPGAAFVYKRDDGRWELEQVLVHADAAPLDEFGTAVDIRGDRVLVRPRVIPVPPAARAVTSRHRSAYTAGS